MRDVVVSDFVVGPLICSSPSNGIRLCIPEWVIVSRELLPVLIYMFAILWFTTMLMAFYGYGWLCGAVDEDQLLIKDMESEDEDNECTEKEQEPTTMSINYS